MAYISNNIPTMLQNTVQNQPAQEGAPGYPGFLTYLNLDNNTLPSQMQVNPNSMALEQLRNTALEQGPSAWTQMAMQGVGNNLTGQINSSNSANAGALAGQKNYLQSNGGLTNTTYNGLQKASNVNSMMNRQALRQNADTQNRDLLLGDQQAKQSALAAIPGQELANTQIKQGNIANNLTQLNQLNANDLARYQTQMQGWASGGQAAAIAGSGKK